MSQLNNNLPNEIFPEEFLTFLK